MEGISKLGIDLWSILIYIVNIGILIAILTKFLYKPILNVLETRQKKIADTISDADKIKAEFEQKLAQMELEREKTQLQLKQEIDNMEKFVNVKKQEMTTKMDEERAKMIKDTNEDLDNRKNKMMSEVETQLLTLMKKIVLEVVHNKVPEKVVQESVSEAWSKYSKK